MASLLVKFDPAVISQVTLLEILISTSAGLAHESLESDVPSRRLHLPVVFNDSVTKETVQRYIRSTKRTKAVFLPDNMEYLAKATGVDGVQGVIETFCRSDWFCTCEQSFATALGPSLAGADLLLPLSLAARSFFLGLPFLFPVSTFQAHGPRSSI